MTSKFYIPPKVPTYLRRILAEYKLDDKLKLAEIISASKIYVVEGTHYDNYDNGTYGHDVKFFLPESIISKIRIREEKQITEELLEDLRISSSTVPNEFIGSVIFEVVNERDDEYQQAIAITSTSMIDPESLSIWKPKEIRLFISHRDKHKVGAYELATALDDYGISSFVAHDSIEPMETWQSEILKALNSMEIMLAFITDDFHDSIWTNQEIGFALGRGIPIVSLKLQNKDPEGFIGSVQAIKGKLDTVSNAVGSIYDVLAEKLGNKARLQSALITAFVEATNYDDAKYKFNHMDKRITKLSDDELAIIVAAYKANDQLHNSIYLNSKYNRLVEFLNRTTTGTYAIQGKNILTV